MATETKKSADNAQASTDALAGSSSQVARKPLTPPAPGQQDAKLVKQTDDEAGAESTPEIGVEDEISYVVAEGSTNAELEGAAGLFGGLAGAALNPLGAAAGLAALALLGGSDGGGGGGDTMPPSPPPPPPPTPGPPPVTGSDATGVVGGLAAVSEGVAENLPGAGEPLGGAVFTVAEGVQSGGDALTPNLPGPLGPGGDALIGNLMATTDAGGNLVSGEQNYGVIGAIEAGGAPAELATPFVAIRDGIAGADASALPGGANLQEAVTDILGASTSNPQAASTAGADELPVEDLAGRLTSSITSAADTLPTGQLPIPPAV